MYVGGLPPPDHFSSTARLPVFSISPLLMLYWFSPRPAPPSKEHVAPGERETYPSPPRGQHLLSRLHPPDRDKTTERLHVNDYCVYTLLVQGTDCQKGSKKVQIRSEYEHIRKSVILAYFTHVHNFFSVCEGGEDRHQMVIWWGTYSIAK